ncbi:MAG: helix-turn-helix transcriptional regulator [Labilithrix sp.]|nr:helix-turn-helix transcriptional regulator [Labilithrix sp.]
MNPTRRTRLKHALIECAIPQYEIAQEVGMSETRLSRIASGRLPPTTEERARLAAFLELPETALFEGHAAKNTRRRAQRVPSPDQTKPANNNR